MNDRSATARLSRPIRDEDRGRAFAAVAVLVVTAAVALSLTVPEEADHPRRSAPRATPHLRDRAATPSLRPPVRAPGRVRQVARRFLGDYLAFVHGRRSSASLHAATDKLREQLIRARPRVSPASRRRLPRVVALDGYEIGPGRWLITADVADRAAVYEVGLVVADRPAGPVVVRVGGD